MNQIKNTFRFICAGLLLLVSFSVFAQTTANPDKKEKRSWGAEYFFVRFDQYSTYHHFGANLKSNRYLLSVGGLFGYDTYVKHLTYKIDNNNYFKISQPIGAYFKAQYSVFPEKKRFNVSFSILMEYGLQKSTYGISVLDTSNSINNYGGQIFFQLFNMGLGLGMTYRLFDQLYLNAEVLCAFRVAEIMNFHSVNYSTNSESSYHYSDWFTRINTEYPPFPKIGLYYLFPNRTVHP